MRAPWHGKRNTWRGSALCALLIASAVLAVRWYRNRPEAGQDIRPEQHLEASAEPTASRQVPPFPSMPTPLAPDEWTLTTAETVISSPRRQA